MLSSIHPLGERARGNRWGRTAAFYVAGAVAGGAVVGTIAGSLGALLFRNLSDGWVVGLVMGLGLGAALIDGFHVRVPSPERQVNETWLARYRSWVYGAGFGFQLGTGVMTFIKTAAIYLLWALAALTGSILAGAAIGAWFGLVRGAALFTVRRVAAPAGLRDYFRRMARLKPVAERVAVTSALIAATVAPALAVAA
jgi:MFS family permease